MPNWCENVLYISKDDAARFILNKNQEVDFNIIAPIPEELDVESSSRGAEAMYYYASNRLTIPKDEVPKKYISFWVEPEVIEKRIAALSLEELDKFYSLGRRYVSNVNNHGAPTWYEWCNKNWGVKWNACDSYVEEDEGLVTIYFNTPWGPPDTWLVRLARKCDFVLAWNEEDGESGEYIAKQGNLY